MSQTAYSLYPAGAYAGQLIPDVPFTLESRVATASIPFGRAVQRVTSDTQVGLTASAGVPQGVAIITHAPTTGRISTPTPKATAGGVPVRISATAVRASMAK